MADQNPNVRTALDVLVAGHRPWCPECEMHPAKYDERGLCLRCLDEGSTSTVEYAVREPLVRQLYAILDENGRLREALVASGDVLAKHLALALTERDEARATIVRGY